MIRNNISEYSREELIQFFKENLKKIEIQFNIMVAMDNYTNKYNIFKKNKSDLRTAMIVVSIIYFVILLLGISEKLLGQSRPNFLVMLIFSTFVFIIVQFVLFIILLVNRMNLKKASKNINNTRNDLIQFINSNPELRVIPLKYQTPSAINLMLDYLINCRANNWTEAVNILEDTIYKNNMLYHQTQQTSLINQQMIQLKKIQSTLDLPSIGFMIGF